MASGLVNVRMVRENLEGVPPYELPEGYGLRWYVPGDEETWVRIHLEADGYTESSLALLAEEFGGDTEELKTRQYYLCDGAGRAFGTATAWMDEDYGGLRWGVVHWVAILPGMQGRGLAKPLMTAVLKRMRELGEERAYLVTATVRVAAINLYRAFGFAPEVRSAEDLALWKGLERELKAPLDLGREALDKRRGASEG